MSIHNMPQTDPYSRIRYSTAFDQKKVYERHRYLLEKLGCSRNSFSSASTTDLRRSYSPVNSSELSRYEKDCLQPLHSARFHALAEPGINAVVEMGLAVSCAVLTRHFSDPESFGTSFAKFAAVSDCLRVFPAALQ